MGKPIKFKNKLQYNKDAIAVARILKKKGILSKAAKLHGGKYISYNVLKKVNALQHLQTGEYRAVTVSKEIASRAKLEGYQTIFGNRIVVPNDTEFIKRVKGGAISGVKPVRGGFMSEVTIPFTADNVGDLLNRLQTETLDDLKLPGERFAFKFGGNMSYRSFVDSATMRNYLEHYKQDAAMEALTVFRLHPSDEPTFINASREFRRKNKTRHRRDGTGRTAYQRKVEGMSDARRERYLAELAEKARTRRAAIMADPVKGPMYKERARARARISYINRKGKKENG